MDVLSASSNEKKIALYVNDSSNKFTEQIISTNTDFISSVFAADVDDDGDIDVISTSSNDEVIALYVNDGSNNFTGQTIFTNTDWAYSVFAADIDGDGDGDVLSASYFYDNKSGSHYNQTALYLNDGSNNFTAQTIFTLSLIHI